MENPTLPKRRTQSEPGPCQTTKMKHFAKKVNGFQPLPIFAKHFILDV